MAFSHYDETIEFKNILIQGKRFILLPEGLLLDYQTKKEVERQVSPSGETEYIIGDLAYGIFSLIAAYFKLLQRSLPEYQEFEVSGFPINGDWSNAGASNVGYRFLDGPLENLDYPGFFIVPSTPWRSINLEGELITSKSGELLSWKRDRGYIVHDWAFEGMRGILRQHRAKMLAFKPYPDNVDLLHINHMDGVKDNNDFDNLEWCTPKENVRHAIELGIVTKEKPVTIRNVYTGEVTDYPSTTVCSESTGFSMSTLFNRLNRQPFGAVYRGGVQFKYTDDPKQLLTPPDIEAAIALSSRYSPEPIRVRLTHIDTGEIEIFNSSALAAKHIGCSIGTLSNILTGKRPDAYKGWLVERA